MSHMSYFLLFSHKSMLFLNVYNIFCSLVKHWFRMDEIEYKLKKSNAILVVNVSTSNVSYSLNTSVKNLEFKIQQLTHILILKQNSYPMTC
jgi:hypothetical protein